jgi:cell division septum initiation protein DivIVA
MSMPGTSIFDPRVVDLMDPEFAKVLKGYDPMEVDTFVFQIKEQIESLERDLRTAYDERDAAQNRYSSLEEEAYRHVTDLMADVIAAADKHVQTMLKDVNQECFALRLESERESAELVRQAKVEADRLRREGEESLRQAQAEVDRILGGLVRRRDDITAELGLIRQRVLGVVEKVDSAVAVASSRARMGNGATPDGITIVPTDTQELKEADLDLPEDLLPFDGGPEGF